MKIIINYDLIDKVCEAKTGFSLHKFTMYMGLVNGLSMPMMILATKFGNTPLVDILDNLLRMLCFSGLHSFVYSSFGKYQAIERLKELSTRLNDICIHTDSELLKGAYQYDVEYNLNFNSIPPKLEQKKYIIVPVYNDWGNNERSVVQEHVIGTRSYALSNGEPEKNKVYSYGRRKVLSNIK